MNIRTLVPIVLLISALGACTPGTSSSDLRERTVALQGGNGTYISCNLKDNDPLRERLLCHSPYIGAWEKFTLVDLGNGQVALRANNGKYVAAELDMGAYLVASRDQVGPFETFEMTPSGDGSITLKAHNDRFVGATLTLPADSAGLLFATAPEAGADQRFRLIVDPQY